MGGRAPWALQYTRADDPSSNFLFTGLGENFSLSAGRKQAHELEHK